MISNIAIETLKQVAHGIAVQFGSDCEVVIYDLDSLHINNGIIFIENANVSGRDFGEDIIRRAIEKMRRDVEEPQDQLAFLTRTHDGRVLKSSVLYIRDEEWRPVAALSINFDITAILALENSLQHVISDEDGKQQVHGGDKLLEDTQFSVNAVLDELIEQSVRIIGKPVALMTREDKVRALRFLDSSGAFLITKSGDKISKQFGISKYTMYSYLEAGKSWPQVL